MTSKTAMGLKDWLILGGLLAGAISAVWGGLLWVVLTYTEWREMPQRMTDLTEAVIQIDQRVGDIENFMPPPRVVEWDETTSGQLGPCRNDICPYALTGARTPYGALCGGVDPASIRVEVRLAAGRVVEIQYAPTFRPVELTLAPRTFPTPLDLSSLVPSGDHDWRTIVEYEHCPGAREPIPRYTPWFPLHVNGTAPDP